MFIHGRRVFLRQMGMAAGTLAFLPYLNACGSSKPVAEVSLEEPPAPTPHVLPDLPYAYDALSPNIDAMTMEIHHSKHHAGYVNNLNKALESHPDLIGVPVTALLADGLSAVPEGIRTAVRNNGGGHLNHALFWKMMAPNAGGEPTGALGAAITQQWGDFATFKAEFKQTALKQFGSGWGWLVKGEGGQLELVGTPEQDSPFTSGKLPILGVDVWEHAYYLNYENRRGDYVDAFFDVVNWAYVSELHAAETPELWASLV